MFDIFLTDEQVEGSSIGNTGQYGELILGTETEAFTSLIGYWSPEDYRLQWKRGIQRLLESRAPTCLITSLHDPHEADVLTWWLLYPEGDFVYVQNSLLFLKALRRSFSTSDPYSSIPRRHTLTDDGDPISEWYLSLGDFRGFLQRTRQR